MQKKLLLWKNADHIDQIKNILLENKVVVGSSDTVFGLLANTTKSGFISLNTLKKRDEKPYIVLIDDISKLKYFVSMMPSDSVFKLLQACWPGPLTAIFDAKREIPEFLTSSDHKIALRIPNHAGLLKLLVNFEGLFSTSANLAGQQVPGLITDIHSNIVDSVDLMVVDSYNPEEINNVLPSTILDCSNDNIKVIRAGAYAIDELERIYGSSF